MRLLRFGIVWILAAVVAIGGALTAFTRRSAPTLARVVDYAESRLLVVRHQIGAAGPGHVLLAGDSNIELLGAPREGCGRALVNAGVSGATAAVYRDFARRIAPWAPSRVTVLTLGTNDLLRKNQPLSPDALARFAGATTAILDTLAARSETLIVTAIPPVGDQQLYAVDPEAVERYSGILAAACRKPQCAFVDPFKPERSETFGVARPGVTEGLHLLRYQAAYADVLHDACRAPE